MACICRQIEHLGPTPALYTAGIVDWPDIRKHFVAERKRLGLTQEQIEKRGKVAQSRLSQIESDPAYTPTIDTFIRAVTGLGITVSSFFLQIERQTESSLRALATSATKDELNPNERGRNDRPVPTPRRRRRELLVDLSSALLDAIAELPDDTREQIAVPRLPSTKKIKRARTGR